nr:nucleotidyltransferase domain-containing protein [Candidatus Freyrarchaeum guaymaensis]
MRGESWSTLRRRSARAEYIKSYVERVVEAERPVGIVVFGSTAKGEEVEGGDIDVLVIYDGEVDYMEKSLILRELDDSCMVEPSPYSYDQAGKMVEEVNPFVFDALEDGVVVYDREGKVRELLRLKEEVSLRLGVVRTERGWEVGAD